MNKKSKPITPKPMPDFKSHQERDDYFRDNADYYSLWNKNGVGHGNRSEYNSLEEAERAAQTKITIGGGRFLIYAVIGEQSALVKAVK